MALKGNLISKSYANDNDAKTGYTGSSSGTPTNGSVYYNTSDSELRVWTGSAFEALGSSGFPTDIPTSNLYLHLDTTDSSSYGGSGTVWTDLQGNRNFTVNASHYVAASSPDPAHFALETADNSSVNGMIYNASGVACTATNTLIAICLRGPYSSNPGNDDYSWATRVLFSRNSSVWFTIYSANSYKRIGAYPTSGTHYLDIWGLGGAYQQNHIVDFGPDSSTVANMYCFRMNSTTTGTTPTMQFSVNGAIQGGSTSSNWSMATNGILFHNIGNYKNQAATTGNYKGWGKICVIMKYDRIITQAEEMQIFAHYKTKCNLVNQGVYALSGGF